MRYSRCRVCKRNRLIVPSGKTWRIRQHREPYGPLHERHTNDWCLGSRKAVTDGVFTLTASVAE